jgi:undecaprenyl diphosphate synthase
MKTMENNRTIPIHVVLLPDGNRRWAKERGLASIEGHLAGQQNIFKFTNYCKERGVKILTAFGFSAENWSRPKKEVKYLMQLLERGFLAELKKHKEAKKDSNLLGSGIRIRVIGQKERLPQSLQKMIKKLEELTKDNKDFILNLAVSYSGRWDIIQAIKKIIKEKIPLKKINEVFFEKYLSTENLPSPDLVIRTSGEKRISNFLLWQTAYAELYFSDKYWPDFSKKDFEIALKEYAKRQRRFGS